MSRTGCGRPRRPPLERLFCHCYARGKGNKQVIPGWPYSFVAALGPGRTSWTLPLDAIRIGPDDDPTEVTAAQVRDVAARLVETGHWRTGDPDILAVFDSGYDLTRLAWLLRDLPVEVAGRLRSDRVMYSPPTAAQAAACGPPGPARPGFRLADPGTWPAPAGDREHRHRPVRDRAGHAPGSGCTSGWPASGSGRTTTGQLPVVEGTVIRLQVERLPGSRTPSRCGCGPPRPEADAGERWPAPGRRSCAASTSSTPSGSSSSSSAGPARSSATRLPPTAGPGSSSPATPSSTSPAPSPPTSGCPGSGHARLAASLPPASAAGSVIIHRTLPVLASAPKPSKPDPGRPSGSRNRRPCHPP